MTMEATPTAQTLDMDALLAENRYVRAAMQVAIHNHCDYQDARAARLKEIARTRPKTGFIPHALIGVDPVARFVAYEAAAAVVRTATGMTKEQANIATQGHVWALCGSSDADTPKRDAQGARPRTTIPGDPTHEEPEGRG